MRERTYRSIRWLFHWIVDDQGNYDAAVANIEESGSPEEQLDDIQEVLDMLKWAIRCSRIGVALYSIYRLIARSKDRKDEDEDSAREQKK